MSATEQISPTKFTDFTQIPNGLLDRLSDYTKFYNLKIILWLLFNNTDSAKGIIEACGIPNSTSFKNNITYSVHNNHVIYNSEAKVYTINKAFFQKAKSKTDNGYYKSLLFTMFPNKFFLHDLREIESIGELKVLLFIFRNTLGWHKGAIKFSLSTLSSKLRASKTTISKGVSSNLSAGRIYSVKKGNSKAGGSLYALSTSQNLDIMIEQPEETEIVKIENTALRYDYFHNGIGYSYPKGRRGDMSWRNVGDEKLTFHHILDAWVELCHVKKYSSQPYRRMDWIRYNSVIGSIKKRGYTPLQFKYAFGYAMNIAMKEEKKESHDLQFHIIGDYIGKAPK